MYIMFPITIMFYFGTNLDRRFSVPDFWPPADMANKIPFERDEITSELERLKQRRLQNRAKRLGMQSRMQEGDDDENES